MNVHQLPLESKILFGIELAKFLQGSRMNFFLHGCLLLPNEKYYFLEQMSTDISSD